MKYLLKSKPSCQETVRQSSSFSMCPKDLWKRSKSWKLSPSKPFAAAAICFLRTSPLPRAPMFLIQDSRIISSMQSIALLRYIPGRCGLCTAKRRCATSPNDDTASQLHREHDTVTSTCRTTPVLNGQGICFPLLIFPQGYRKKP